MRTSNPLKTIIAHRLTELNLAKLPPQIIEHLEAELHEDFARLVERRLTAAAIARAIPRVLRARKAATQPAPDAAAATVANG